MPSAQEIFGLVIGILVIWVVLKMAKLAIKVIFIVLTLLIAGAVIWFVFAR